MIHRTETGVYPSIAANPKAKGGSSISQSIITHLNRPLPWVTILALCLVWMTWIAAKAESKSESVNTRLSDKIAADAQVQTAYEQTLKYYTGEVVKAQTETRMLEYYVVDLTAAANASKLIPKDYDFEKFKQQRGK